MSEDIIGGIVAAITIPGVFVVTLWALVKFLGRP